MNHEDIMKNLGRKKDFFMPYHAITYTIITKSKTRTETTKKNQLKKSIKRYKTKAKQSSTKITYNPTSSWERKRK